MHRIHERIYAARGGERVVHVEYTYVIKLESLYRYYNYTINFSMPGCM